MSRQSELSDEEDIQRGVKCTGDLVRDRHAAARQREDDDIASKMFYASRKSDPSLPAVFVQLFVTELCGHELLLALLCCKPDLTTTRLCLMIARRLCDPSLSFS
jgi:hypothetical protein